MHVRQLRLALPRWPIWSLLGLCLVILAIMLLIPPTHLAKIKDTAIVVDTFEDELSDGGNDCSLREAIQAASTDSPVDGCPAGDGDDAILLPAGRYVLTLTGADEDLNQTGDLDILTGTVILMGPGPERTVIDGNHSDRVLHVHPGAVVKIHGLQITNGETGVDEPTINSKLVHDSEAVAQAARFVPTPIPEIRWTGGGIHNGGSLELDHSLVQDNQTRDGSESHPDAAHGGGIYNSGALTLNHTSVVDNVTGSGAGHGYTGFLDGDGGFGGGIYSRGALALFSSVVSGNSTGDGGSGWAVGGRGGLGGGIYSTSTLTLSNSLVVSNTCGGGGMGPAGYGARGGDGGGLYNAGSGIVTSSVVAGNLTGPGGLGDYGSGGGQGGGIYNAGTLALSRSSIRENATGDGGISGWGPYLNSGGAGGGIYNYGTLDMSKSTISGNKTGDGGLDPGGEGNGGGSGGGILNLSMLTATDSTISGNTTGDGNGESGHAGSGGGIASFGSLTLYNSTVSANRTGNLVIDGIGGGVYNYGAIMVGNTILAGNLDASGPNDCQEGGDLQSQGYNLVEVAGSCAFTASGDVVSVQPRLGPLGDHGGETLTHALLRGSPAIDQGSCRTSSTDQRGLPRPVDVPRIGNADDGCDIGAFEVQAGFYIYLPLTTRYAGD